MSKNRKPDLGQTNPFLDEAYLGGVKTKQEKISLKYLSSVENARKMTLCDLVNLVNKCEKPFRAKPATASSKLRTEAAKFYGKHRKQIKELHTPILMTPGLLTANNKEFSQNNASHDQAVNRPIAAVGPVMAASLLNTFFSVSLRNWDFRPRFTFGQDIDTSR